MLSEHVGNENFKIIEIQSGEINKGIESCKTVWNAMIELGADRHSILVNLGGGVIGDLGGFAASTFKRGMDFIQMPTTLLAQVDASIGGKLGIDYGRYKNVPLKNVIGVYNNPAAVLINHEFLKTLPARELANGFAEIIKHALIADISLWNKIQEIGSLQMVDWPSLIKTSLEIKQDIVEEDPFEQGRRKALNFGHTIGHALESYMVNSNSPLLHGEAVAIGMICESWLSAQAFVLKSTALKQITEFIMRFYPKLELSSEMFEDLIDLMRHDKKNEGKRINFTLLRAPGNSVINQHCDEETIVQAFKYYQSL